MTMMMTVMGATNDCADDCIKTAISVCLWWPHCTIYIHFIFMMMMMMMMMMMASSIVVMIIIMKIMILMMVMIASGACTI